MAAGKPALNRLRGGTGRWLRRLSRMWATPERLLITLAMFIGIITGLGAVGFSALIDVVTAFFFLRFGGALDEHQLLPWLLPILPMTGALLVGLITYYLAPEAEGHGVPEVMDAMARKGGRIRPRVAGAKAVASALTIGSGGAAGTEGPIIQIGAAIGSGFGQWLRMSLDDIRVLIGCGAAAGISSIFNAPIAGVLFAVEVLLRDMSLRSFMPIIVASVLSSVVTQVAHGRTEAIFPVPYDYAHGATPTYEFTVPEFGNYLVLGLVCGLVAVGFVKLLYWSEDAFRKLPLHRVLRPVLGAALLGLVTIGVMGITNQKIPRGGSVASATVSEESIAEEDEAVLPAVMGNGYPIIGLSLDPAAYRSAPQWTFAILIILLAGKVLCTCLTLGSGGSGGVFAPSLFIGATTGGAFGLLVQQLPWFGGVSPGAYALVGMAAVVAASIHAPLTATLMLFELTRDYKVIVPIMLAAVAGLSVARYIETASIYTLKLRRRGVRFGGEALRALQRVCVRDLRRLRAPVVSPGDPVDSLVRIMRTTTANDFLVVDEKGRFAGMVLGDDLRTMLLESDAMPLLTVSDVLRDDVPVVHLDETLDVVMSRFHGKPMQSLPVINAEQPREVGELVTRAAVMNRYNQLLESSGS